MADSTEQLLQDLARHLKIDQFPRNAAGAIELSVGDATSVFLFAESANTLMLACPVMPVPVDLDTASALWLLGLNFYDSPLAPFRVAADPHGQLLLWSRLPGMGMSGAELAGVIDGLAAQVERIRAELATEEDGPR